MKVELFERTDSSIGEMDVVPRVGELIVFYGKWYNVRTVAYVVNNVGTRAIVCVSQVDHVWPQQREMVGDTHS